MKSRSSLEDRLRDLDAWGHFIANRNLPNYDLPKGLVIYAILGTWVRVMIELWPSIFKSDSLTGLQTGHACCG